MTPITHFSPDRLAHYDRYHNCVEDVARKLRLEDIPETVREHRAT